MRTETTPDQNNTLAVNVVSSQKTDCAGGSTPRIQVADLQDMHNQFAEQLDSGLESLAEIKARTEFPRAPPPIHRRTLTAQLLRILPPSPTCKSNSERRIKPRKKSSKTPLQRAAAEN